MSSQPVKLATTLAQASHQLDPHTGAITPPVHPSTTYARNEHYEPTSPNLSYSRDHNPTYKLAENVLTELEGGADALLFASGLAAASAVFQTLRPGDHVVAPVVMYHGLRDWLGQFCSNWGVTLDYFDTTKDRALERAVKPGRTRIVWIETPSNPTWDVTDIAASSELAHRAGAYLAVDSTVPTPVLTRPLEHGADIVFHSATKYLNGHSDVVAGALICRALDELWGSIRFQRRHTGGVLGPFEAWLLLRGMRTLAIRVRQSCDNALSIARHFEDHRAIERVLYPGLKSHPGYAVAKRQMSGGFGGMLSLLVKGDGDTARRIASRTHLFVPATSLGGVESLIEHRATVEGPQSPVPENLLRLSVGIEDAGDLIEDLERALE